MGEISEGQGTGAVVEGNEKPLLQVVGSWVFPSTHASPMAWDQPSLGFLPKEDTEWPLTAFRHRHRRVTVKVGH